MQLNEFLHCAWVNLVAAKTVIKIKLRKSKSVFLTIQFGAVCLRAYI